MGKAVAEQEVPEPLRRLNYVFLSEGSSFAREAGRTDIEGQLAAFAASPGQFASDGVAGEGNSPYTERLLQELENPDVALQVALSGASKKVLRLTNSSQRPYLASDLSGDIYLRRKPATRQCKAIVAAVDHAGSTRFGGIRDGSELLLLAADTMNEHERVVRNNAIPVGALSAFMREAAAASVLVLDTAFPDPGAS